MGRCFSGPGAIHKKLRIRKKDTFVRFVLKQRHPDSGVEEGLFRLAYELKDSPNVDNEDRSILKDSLEWFAKNLPVPKRFNRSKSKGFYRRTTRGIAWFRDTAKDCLQHMYRIKDILEDQGYPVIIINEFRVGYVIYEDSHQIIAEPFSDTRTG